MNKVEPSSNKILLWMKVNKANQLLFKFERNLKSYKDLLEQLQEASIGKEYEA